MKIYECIVMDIFTGEILYEKSYEYKGQIALCKGGEYAAKREAERAYKMQVQQQALQQQQLLELEEKEKSKKFNEQQLLESRVKKTKTGRSGTILTGIQDFGSADVSKKSLYA